ncbi:hypothetical protein N5P37_009282 [Trichoderma harzianum]|jgi:uncharacterized protein (TIGR02452 family)|uniref:Microbial-type PARG catalytic domain-containing protein n=1 Tax=Trichoderma harzianum CBS 226.95 TaxID=983964 RepID=A0A2T4A8G5_TRIHA|nr:hypothetical protein M431DRAFT_509613 [Trichoderma harzianum CBS 226.95]KAK0757986.1 hypothetical protein N5P37_009282 [Trichoderma harzianum]PKK45740.1 hypothetical protein CI102_9650 [Trichoderma harzianum]PTB53336.1 hypothetical protein M431DRAFT_509613 [Trichoderma harzianum CBS 226.95]
MSSSRDERAKAAKLFLNKKLPSILKSNARARKGVESVQLIVDPPRIVPKEAIAPAAATTSPESTKQTDGNDLAPTSQKPLSTPLSPNSIRIWPVDTLEAASRLSKSSPSRIAVLNMASPLRPGGGVLTGATSQEEWLCSRTTLYPSLHEEFYRLPEVGAIYTPDVLVCKTWDTEPSDLKPADQFLIDVITAAMLRLPEVETNQQGELKYSEQKDRDMVLAKMRCVMRILRSRHIERVVLGAWGCGAYGNPVDEIARSWKRVLLGPQAKRSERVEVYDDMEVVFAIKDHNMARRFTTAFGAGAMLEESGGDGVD